jgi:catechol 2,3-dioxygenase-like lactoylglutathione lyase family enzyme
LLGVVNREEAVKAWDVAFVEAVEAGSARPLLMLRTGNLAGAVADLQRRGVTCATAEALDGDSKIADLAWLPNANPVALDVRFVQYSPETSQRRAARLEAEGLLAHAIPLKRLDHLTAVAPDLEAATRYWTESLGVPLHGEVRSPTTVIRQFKIGDAILELLGPATPDSPVGQRPAGLVSMIACEVPDVEAAVATARAVGFTPSEPAAGVLPGTRTATIPATELSGLALQLLQYV